MTQNQNLKEDLHIEEILLESNALGMRQEVKNWAKKLLIKNPKMSKVDAYQEAYNEWIK